MATCFVMQPFDGGFFDKRFDSIFCPAIEAAGLEAYRVDKDPGTTIPIDDIEQGIRDTDICLADITLDNPNVWFELGYAIACNKEVVLVCSDERKTRFPFDIQHRTIIRYGTGAPQEYEKLKADITAKIRAFLKKAETLAAVSSRVASIEGLGPHELVCLTAIAANLDHPEDHASTYVIKNDMEKSGSTRLAAAISLKSLIDKGFVVREDYSDFDGTYVGFSLTQKGWSWIIANQDKFNLKKESEKPEFDDDIPF